MFNLFSKITASVREAVLAGFRQAMEAVKSGEPGESQEAQKLFDLMDRSEPAEPVNRLLEHEANGKRKIKA